MADKYYRISLNSKKTDLSENIILPPVRSTDSGTVIALAKEMFLGKTNIKSVIIPEGVTHIMDSTFSGCTGLIEITIPAGVINMGANVFNNCTNITKIVVNKTREEVSINPNWDNNWLGDTEESKVEYLPTYAITFEGWANGTITADKNPSKVGEEIQLKIVPTEGYKISWVKYNGKVLNSPYKFIMPAEDVEITAEFIEIGKPDIPDVPTFSSAYGAWIDNEFKSLGSLTEKTETIDGVSHLGYYFAFSSLKAGRKYCLYLSSPLKKCYSPGINPWEEDFNWIEDNAIQSDDYPYAYSYTPTGDVNATQEYFILV